MGAAAALHPHRPAAGVAIPRSRAEPSSRPTGSGMPTRGSGSGEMPDPPRPVGTPPLPGSTSANTQAGLCAFRRPPSRATRMRDYRTRITSGVRAFPAGPRTSRRPATGNGSRRRLDRRKHRTRMCPAVLEGACFQGERPGAFPLPSAPTRWGAVVPGKARFSPPGRLIRAAVAAGVGPLHRDRPPQARAGRFGGARLSDGRHRGNVADAARASMHFPTRPEGIP